MTGRFLHQQRSEGQERYVIGFVIGNEAKNSRKQLFPINRAILFGVVTAVLEVTCVQRN
jgi:hypothetical protein